MTPEERAKALREKECPGLPHGNRVSMFDTFAQDECWKCIAESIREAASEARGPLEAENTRLKEEIRTRLLATEERCKLEGDIRTLEAENTRHVAEVEAVLATIPGAVRVRESNGPEDVFASLAVSVAKLIRANTPLREERDALRSLLSRVERLTGVGPPSRPGKPTPGSTWYDLLVQVNALVRGSRERAISPESRSASGLGVDGTTSDKAPICKLGHPERNETCGPECT